jgi:hypothetical protein
MKRLLLLLSIYSSLPCMEKKQSPLEEQFDELEIRLLRGEPLRVSAKDCVQICSLQTMLQLRHLTGEREQYAQHSGALAEFLARHESLPIAVREAGDRRYDSHVLTAPNCSSEIPGPVLYTLLEYLHGLPAPHYPTPRKRQIEHLAQIPRQNGRLPIWIALHAIVHCREQGKVTELKQIATEQRTINFCQGKATKKVTVTVPIYEEQ